MMKRKYFYAALALCCTIAMSVTLTSCNDDDEDKPTKEQTDEEKSYFDRTLASADITYIVRLGKDELKLYNVTVSYMDEYGKENSFAMTDTTWQLKRSLKPGDLPAKFVLRCSPDRKYDVTVPNDEVVTVGCITRIDVVVKNSYGRIICDVDDMGLSQTEFVEMTGEHFMSPWSEPISDIFGSIFGVDKKTVNVYEDKIVYNGMTQRYW